MCVVSTSSLACHITSRSLQTSSKYFAEETLEFFFLGVKRPDSKITAINCLQLLC